MRYSVNIQMMCGETPVYNTFTLQAQGKAEALDKTLTIMNTLDGDFSSLNITAQADYKEEIKCYEKEIKCQKNT